MSSCIPTLASLAAQAISPKSLISKAPARCLPKAMEQLCRCLEELDLRDPNYMLPCTRYLNADRREFVIEADLSQLQKLRVLRLGPTVRKLPSLPPTLQELTIHNFSATPLELPEVFPQSLESLELVNTHTRPQPPQQTRELTNLRHLHIVYCPLATKEIDTETLSTLTSLESLVLRGNGIKQTMFENNLWQIPFVMPRPELAQSVLEEALELPSTPESAPLIEKLSKLTNVALPTEIKLFELFEPAYKRALESLPMSTLRGFLRTEEIFHTARASQDLRKRFPALLAHTVPYPTSISIASIFEIVRQTPESFSSRLVEQCHQIPSNKHTLFSLAKEEPHILKQLPELGQYAPLSEDEQNRLLEGILAYVSSLNLTEMRKEALIASKPQWSETLLSSLKENPKEEYAIIEQAKNIPELTCADRVGQTPEPLFNRLRTIDLSENCIHHLPPTFLLIPNLTTLILERSPYCLGKDKTLQQLRERGVKIIIS